MSLRASTALAPLLLALLAGCAGGDEGSSGCTGDLTRFTAQAAGLRDALLERPAGVDVETQGPGRGMDFDGDLPWEGAELQSLAWRPDGGEDDEDGDEAAQPAGIALTGTGRDLRLAAALPGRLEQAQLRQQVQDMLAAATDLEPGERAGVAEGMEWRSGEGLWHSSAELRATVRLPQDLADVDDWDVTREAGLVQGSDEDWTVSVRLPVERMAWEAAGMAAVLQVDEEDQASLEVGSRGHEESDAWRVHAATLALTGWNGEASWTARHLESERLGRGFC
jgi:hypothetical protein